MLNELEIHNFAIIKHMTVSFEQGLNVMTGETGSGKSIILKALQFLLGAKVSIDIIRHGEKQTLVCGRFQVNDDHPVHKLFSEFEIPLKKDDHELILIKRTLSQSKRSCAWVNDMPVTISSLKKITSSLVEVFAQHDDLQLLQEEQHIAQLDAFVALKIRQQVQASYKDLLQLYEKIQEKLNELEKRQGSRDYLHFRTEELTQFSPSADDYQQVIMACRTGEKNMSLRQALSHLQQQVDACNGHQAMSELLWNQLRTLENDDFFLQDQRAFLQQIERTAQALDDLSCEVSRRLEDTHYEEESFESAQKRLADYQSYFRKFQVKNADDLVKLRLKLQEELTFIDNASDQVTALLKKAVEKAQPLSTVVQRLSTLRKSAAKNIEKKITQEFVDLGMPKARFKVLITGKKEQHYPLDLSILGPQDHDLQKERDILQQTLAHTSPQGQDKVQFLLQSNPGQDPQALNKIASGGELSRILLALKRILAQDQHTTVLIFDEVDKGISGRIADKVGHKIKSLSEQTQVLCISHLAQVTAYADHHLLVEKKQNRSSTHVEITVLQKKQRIDEIARLLSGKTITSASQVHAQQLIEQNLQSSSSII